MRDAAYHVLALLYLMAPAYCANMAPPFVRFWRVWNAPIHACWFGTHKTVLGFITSVVAGVTATALQAIADAPFSLAAYKNWLSRGLSFGLGAMGGDAVKSFFKRRLGNRPGARWIPFNQLDFITGALVLIAPSVNLSIQDVASVLAATFLGDIAVNQVAYRFGIKEHAWKKAKRVKSSEAAFEATCYREQCSGA